MTSTLYLLHNGILPRLSPPEFLYIPWCQPSRSTSHQWCPDRWSGSSPCCRLSDYSSVSGTGWSSPQSGYRTRFLALLNWNKIQSVLERPQYLVYLKRPLFQSMESISFSDQIWKVLLARAPIEFSPLMTQMSTVYCCASLPSLSWTNGLLYFVL